MMSPRDVTPTPEDMRSNIILLHQKITQERLEKQNRYLILAVFVLISSLFVIGFFTLPTGMNLSQTLKNKQQATDEKLSMRETEVDRLKGELVGIVSGSIDRKLTTLEEGIKLGSVLNSLQTLENIRTDVKALHKYSDPLIQKQQQNTHVNTALRQEVSALRNLIYITLGSCSLIFCAFLLIWVRHKKKLPYQQQDDVYLTSLTK